ncbi:hypothetical protein HPB49_016147 [Dermacentor silvarum]|uniref:Uncharacterized protein n=1 Tax=Dermacentor silvarum TaxID=543639 RepID=A0ACB8CA66_DERSI|nr:hypothetical protein HPB49_016147 [Dermacentor silvarum]
MDKGVRQDPSAACGSCDPYDSDVYVRKPGNTTIQQLVSSGVEAATYDSADDATQGDTSSWEGNDDPGSDLHPNVRDRMRRKLRFFFMNPIEKYQAKKRIPWKLVLQVVKIALVTLQLVLFGTNSYSYQQQHRDTTVALHHIFLFDWDSVREIANYPPAAGPYAVYTKAEFYRHVDHVAIGSFGYDSPTGALIPLVFCKTYYRKGYVWPFNDTLIFDNYPVRRCLAVEGPEAGNPAWLNFSTESYLREHNFSIIFERLINVNLEFTLKTVYLKSLSKFDLPDCYRYNITIYYDNEAHDGQLLISLGVHSKKLDCTTNVLYTDSNKIAYACLQAVNVIVIVICASSLVLCVRSLIRGQTLRKKTVRFFAKYYKKKLMLSDKMEFVDFWYVMIAINDILIILGSCFKIQLEQRVLDGQQYNLCSALLGTGNLLVWAGVLRYLGFFKKYNILILTMRRAFPNILRFLLCALLLYCGFCFCGWVVLGPHHIKFRSLSMTSECLFALMNGDDMFATFAILSESDGIIWWFCRFYLYLFLILFIYCVLSLFLSVIMDSYETIREIHEHGAQPGELQKFILECSDTATSTAYLEDDQSPKRSRTHIITDCFSCFRRRGYNPI